LAYPITAACECGAAIKLSAGVGNIGEDDEVLVTLNAWFDLHTGPGHGPANTAEAKRIRDAARSKPSGRKRPERVS
jgi:hypothetical protein